MNSDFPRVLTLLRKERGFSQKKAAADLGISQALLSHYEEGIRECGLDFLVRAAAYYGVSCDYLLGRTPHRTGAVVSLPGENSGPTARNGAPPAEYQRRALVNAINIVFGLLKKINSEGLTQHASSYLDCAVYKIFRLLYSARGKNPQEAFALNRRLYSAQTDAHMVLAEAKVRYLLEGWDLEDAAGVSAESLPLVSLEKLTAEFPLYTASLLELLHNTEQSIAGKKPE